MLRTTMLFSRAKCFDCGKIYEGYPNAIKIFERHCKRTNHEGDIILGFEVRNKMKKETIKKDYVDHWEWKGF